MEAAENRIRNALGLTTSIGSWRDGRSDALIRPSVRAGRTEARLEAHLGRLAVCLAPEIGDDDEAATAALHGRRTSR